MLTTDLAGHVDNWHYRTCWQLTLQDMLTTDNAGHVDNWHCRTCRTLVTAGHIVHLTLQDMFWHNKMCLYAHHPHANILPNMPHNMPGTSKSKTGALLNGEAWPEVTVELTFPPFPNILSSLGLSHFFGLFFQAAPNHYCVFELITIMWLLKLKKYRCTWGKWFWEDYMEKYV